MPGMSAVSILKETRQGIGTVRMRWGCILALPGEYDWTVYVLWRCGLMSNYFDHLRTTCNNKLWFYLIWLDMHRTVIIESRVLSLRLSRFLFSMLKTETATVYAMSRFAFWIFQSVIYDMEGALRASSRALRSVNGRVSYRDLCFTRISQ